MKRSAIAVCLAAMAFLASCAHTPSALDLNDLGNRYYHAGQYEKALGNYHHALDLAAKSGDAQYEAIAMFGMARANAQLCHPSEAEKWFTRSIEARRKLPNLNEAYLTQNLLEYGRFLRSQSRRSEAVAMFDQAMPMLQKLNIELRDPKGYALVLKEYEKLLQSAGRENEAKSIAEKASVLESQYHGIDPKFIPEGYPKC